MVWCGGNKKAKGGHGRKANQNCYYENCNASAFYTFLKVVKAIRYSHCLEDWVHWRRGGFFCAWILAPRTRRFLSSCLATISFSLHVSQNRYQYNLILKIHWIDPNPDVLEDDEKVFFIFFFYGYSVSPTLHHHTTTPRINWCASPYLDYCHTKPQPAAAIMQGSLPAPSNPTIGWSCSRTTMAI